MATTTTTTTLTELTAATFDEAILAIPEGKLLVIDFWAEWCPPCIALAPILEELAADLHDTVVFAKVDIEAHPELATRFQVLSFPTLLVFDDRDPVQPVRRLVGLRGKRHLAEELAALS